MVMDMIYIIWRLYDSRTCLNYQMLFI